MRHANLRRAHAMIHWLCDPADPLPGTQCALGADSDAPGLLAAGGELSPQRLAEAYSNGVFPWYSAGQPVLWWSPDPRMVLFTEAFKLSRSLRKAVQRFAGSPACEVRIDSAFRSVISACAGAPREGQDGTWIVPSMIDAYCAWHALGRAHSVETWIDGELAGGLYGVSLGRMFFGESMFSNRSDASKIALAALVCFCRAHGMPMIDCQQHTGHLETMGARQLSRTEFEARLAPILAAPDLVEWTYDLSLWRHLKPAATEDTGL